MRRTKLRLAEPSVVSGVGWNSAFATLTIKSRYGIADCAHFGVQQIGHDADKLGQLANPVSLKMSEREIAG